MRGLFHGLERVLNRQRILLPHIKEALMRADGKSTDDEPLQHAVGISLEDTAIHVGAGSPSSPFTSTYLMSPGAFRVVSHFFPVTKPPPPRPRKPDFLIWSMISSGFMWNKTRVSAE